MTEPFGRLRRFLRELKRRKVYRVAVGYLVAAFVVLQLAGLAADAFGFPGWFQPMVWVLAGLGFPLAGVLAWAFEATPEGVRRTAEAEPAEEGAYEVGHRFSSGHKVLVSLGLVAAAVAGGWYLAGRGGYDTPGTGDRSVAVLPFETLGQKDSGAFTQGMHATLQTKLSNVAGLTVTSSRSAERYGGSDESTAAVARQLGVGWIVTGDVQRMGDQIQVNVRLVDPDTDAQAWSDSYRRDLTAENLFAIQTDITREVAQALQTELSSAEADRVERAPTQNLDAYRLYVRGRDLLDRRTTAAKDSAIRYFKRALRQDSSYALAWAGLADARALSPFDASRGRVDSVRRVLPEAEAAARRALQLAPDLAEARASMGFIHFLRREGPAALQELRRSVELKPSYAQAHHWLGALLMNLGRQESALQHYRLAVELNPGNRSVWDELVTAQLANRNYREALEISRRAETRNARVVTSSRAEVLLHLKRWEQLRTLAPDSFPDRGPRPRRLFKTQLSLYQGLAELASGDTASARNLLQELRPRFNDEGLTARVAATEHALLYAALEQPDSAFAVLDRAFRLNPDDFPQYSSLPLRYLFPDWLRPIRADSRYRDLIGKINQRWGLNPDGSLPDSMDVSFDLQSNE